MKIEVTMKTPDALYDALEHIENGEVISVKLNKWFRYGEMVTLVYDTEKDTLEVKEI